ncbi:GTP pyrophosphokinase [Mobilicoccus caccae]|uniref:RelA/SpoT domain-containing protein n=1 Tax=Mobilicoccus caccae TaxID=1859295 RepID=A0ABQ6IQS9_9MICO|nr:hypothetical protein [Mobilicoccus caccae]GMA40280.1 hypothetical protein GCM10025883_23250 [Mobilicoccus caccae]
MTADLSQDDYCNWDWLPQAAREAEAVLSRLLAEPSIKAHVITARAKTIESFLKKCAHKEYPNPMAEVTDTVAARIITYSVTDRDRVAELVRVRFHVKENEDRNPGDERPVKKRGYDCIHLVVTGERVGSGDSGWLIRQGYLANYFKKFGGLEIQVRTVAAHAWAEFEHARRYKGEAYHAVTLHDQATVDQLFGAAADARKALDEIFESIDRVLANPPNRLPRLLMVLQSHRSTI